MNFCTLQWPKSNVSIDSTNRERRPDSVAGSAEIRELAKESKNSIFLIRAKKAILADEKNKLNLIEDSIRRIQNNAASSKHNPSK